MTDDAATLAQGATARVTYADGTVYRTFDCGECGMLIEAANQFHPFWHCVLFKGGMDPRKPLDPPDPRIQAAEAERDEALGLLGRGVALMQFVAERGPDAGYWRGDAAEWAKKVIAYHARHDAQPGGGG